jgi:hypothetical protein
LLNGLARARRRLSKNSDSGTQLENVLKDAD